MAVPHNFDDIIDSVAKDFFGSSDQAYKDLVMTSDLKSLEESLKKTRESLSLAENEELKKTMEQLSRLDDALLHGSGAKPGEEASGVKEASAAEAAAAAEEAPEEPEVSAMEELNSLIGLENIKHDVKELVSFMKIQKMREEKGNKTVPVSLHLVFTGNPGTGKTTIARILARLYREIGVLSKGQLVEVDRSGLVAGYVGQTAAKTQAKIQEALGGILFIDEAYTLSKEGNDFGQEAIDTILKAMEDHRKDLIVIVAGYTDLMKTFIESNPGLKSRFNKYIEFPDYSADELYRIFLMNCDKYGYRLSDDASLALKSIIDAKLIAREKDFANAREMRNLFEAVITNQATRLADEALSADSPELDLLEQADFADFLSKTENENQDS